MYEYMEETVVKKMYSDDVVIRPRTKESSACLCFSLDSLRRDPGREIQI